MNMDDLSRSVESHYHREGLFEEICERLQQQGIDLKRLSRKDLGGVDEFHVRGAAVSEELAQTIDLRGARLLDVGCGIGGPCRMLAEKYACITTGIDLNPEFIRTAQEISRLLGLLEKTTFLQANATQMPFGPERFDVVWTQHAQMNVKDKEGFYGEIYRVLKPGGYFLYYDIFKAGKEAVTYPLPWAETEALSFLFPAAELDKLLSHLGFRKLQSQDQTAAGVAFFEETLARIRASGPPRLGVGLLMGASTLPKLSNLLEQLKEGKLMLQSGVYVK